MPFRVGDERERQLGLVLGELRRGGVEDDDLSDAVRADLVVAPDDRASVEVADRASGEAPKLKMDEVACGSGIVTGLPELAVMSGRGKASPRCAFPSVSEVA